MPVDTGPDSNLFSIPEIDLGDTFNTWRDITNLSVYKLNKLKIYDGISSSSISANVSGGGTAAFELQDNITKGVSFISPVVFSSGVTFNGAVTFNAPTFTVNANIVTIDDYNLVLGDTAAASDENISQAGGGGLQINRGSGKTASWLWNPVNIHGSTGLWLPDGNIGFTSGGAVVPYNGTTLGVHGTGILLDGGSTTEHGLLVSVSSAGGGNTSNREINFSRYSPAGATLFMQVLNGSTYTTSGLSAGQQPFVRIPNGVNKKIVKQENHTFVVGSPVSMDSAGQYFLATADTSTNAEVVGIVSHVLSASEFEITFIGEIFGIDLTTNQDSSGSSLITGAVYYLSPYYSGKVTATQPTQAGVVHKAVFIATSANSAIVYPWTGGILSEPIVLSSSAQTSVRINQLNQFKLGDIVRFRPVNTTLTYNYLGTYQNLGATSGTYANGIFVRAQANSTSEAEVAGIVILREEIGNTGVYRAFNLLMDGFFEFPGGVSAMNGGSPTGLNAGTVYFLNTNCAGTTGSFENPSVPCYNNGHPTVAGQVRKPMLYATSSTTGYLFSYRGDVTGLPGVSSSVPLSDLLIQDLGSCGGAADLNFGVRDVAGSAGGVRVMTFDGTTKGNVRIGPSSFNASSSGAGASLSVFGPILAGDAEGVGGSVIIGSRYGVYPSTLNVFGGKFSTGNSYLSRAVRGITSAVGYQSSTGQNLCRAAIEVGEKDISGTNRPALLFLGHSAGATTTAIGTAVQMTEYFSVAGLPSGGARVTSGEFETNYTKSGLGIGISTPGASLDVKGTMQVFGQLFARVDSGVYLSSYGSGVTSAVIGVRKNGNNYEWGHTNPGLEYACFLGAQPTNGAGFIGLHAGAADGINQYVTKGFTGWVIRNTIGGDPLYSFQIGAVVNSNADNQELSPYLTISPLGNVGIGTIAPGASLDVNGKVRVKGTVNVNSNGQLDIETPNGNFLKFNTSGGAGNYNGINANSEGGSYLIFGAGGPPGVGHTFAIAPWSAGTNGLLMSYNGTTVNVGVNTSNPVATLDVNGTLKVSGQITHGSAPVAVPSGTAPVFGARAWVNFNGTSTVAIRSSGNVTSITDNGTGNYTVNFTTEMPDANYAFVGTSSDPNDDAVGPVAVGAKHSAYVPTTTGRQFETVFNGTNYDSTFCSVVIFR